MRDNLSINEPVIYNLRKIIIKSGNRLIDDGLCLQATTGSGYFEVQILSLTNNRGTLVDGRCCGGGSSNNNNNHGGTTRSISSSSTTNLQQSQQQQQPKYHVGPCTTPCTTAFWLCLKEYQSNVTAIGSCSFGNVSSHALGQNTFTLTEPVTLQLHFTFRWTVSIYTL